MDPANADEDEDTDDILFCTCHKHDHRVFGADKTSSSNSTFDQKVEDLIFFEGKFCSSLFILPGL